MINENTNNNTLIIIIIKMIAKHILSWIRLWWEFEPETFEFPTYLLNPLTT